MANSPLNILHDMKAAAHWGAPAHYIVGLPSYMPLLISLAVLAPAWASPNRRPPKWISQFQDWHLDPLSAFASHSADPRYTLEYIFYPHSLILNPTYQTLHWK